jgi:hypothetical protein
MTYKVVSQKKIEDTKQGQRFEILVKDSEDVIWRSTYVLFEKGNGTHFYTSDDANLQLGAKMTEEEIWKETWGYLIREGYTN